MNIQHLVKQIKSTVDNHYLGNGHYSRFLEDDPVTNPYGCADAANILYTIGAFERDFTKRNQLVSALRSFQHEDGLFYEDTHHPYHTTAHCIAALELFDSLPLFPVKALDKYKNKAELYSFLENLDWINDPWNQSHQGAGLCSTFFLTGNATAEWQKWFFDWLETHTNKEYGIGYQGAIQTKAKKISHHLNGWFHYLFNVVFARKPIPYAQRAVDTCLQIYQEKRELILTFGKTVGFAEIDWIYVLHRASKQEGYRVDETKQAIREFAKNYIDYLSSLNHSTDKEWNDLHLLFGCVCALAELQLALPGEIQTDYPLRIVLDRRPFI